MATPTTPPSDLIAVLIVTASGAVTVHASVTWDFTRQAVWTPPSDGCKTVLSYCYKVTEAYDSDGQPVQAQDLEPYADELDAQVLAHIEANLD